MDHIVKILESINWCKTLWNMLLKNASETVWNKEKQEGGFCPAMMGPLATSVIAPMVSLLIQPVASSLINIKSGKGVRRTGKG